MAGTADDEGLAPFPGHEGRPRWLARPGRAELGESGDVVDCHRGAVIAQLAPPPAEPANQLFARGVDWDRGGVSVWAITLFPRGFDQVIPQVLALFLC